MGIIFLPISITSQITLEYWAFIISKNDKFTFISLNQVSDLKKTLKCIISQTSLITSQSHHNSKLWLLFFYNAKLVSALIEIVVFDGHIL